MSAPLTHRCDASGSGAEPGAVVWLRLRDDGELRLCVHHSERHADGLMRAGFRPVPDVGVTFGGVLTAGGVW